MADSAAPMSRRPDSGVSTKSLRKDLAGLVPGYMLPARWMRYDVLPKTTTARSTVPAEECFPLRRIPTGAGESTVPR